MHSSIFLILGYNFAIYLCIFRSIKLPSVQQAVSHTKPVQTSYTRGKSMRGRGSIARGRLCIFRSIKLPSVQQAVSHTKPVQTSYTRGKSTRGHGSIARGHTRSSATKGTLKEIKEAVTKKKRRNSFVKHGNIG